MLTDRRLTGIQLFRRFGKTFRFIYGNKDLQVTCFDDRVPSQIDDFRFCTWSDADYRRSSLDLREKTASPSPLG